MARRRSLPSGVLRAAAPWHAILLAAAFGLSVPLATGQERSSSRWPVTTPESQGFDSGVLSDLLEYVRAKDLPLHNLLVIRRGQLILDASLYPYSPKGPHDVTSVTKSITSLLMGIAIDKGLVESVRQPVVSLLPGAVRGTPDAQRQALTVEHLLTMTSGLDCGYEPGERELAAMRRRDDWPAFVLALPMRAAPGMQYAYCSCNSHLLSAILSARTGGSALAFARTHLFDPLGISTASWPADNHGRTHGWGDLHLFPTDLAKIGELYRTGGVWKGRRILSESWVRQSTQPHVRVREGVGYGYAWWINTAREPAIYEAVGRGGQRVAVVPDKELVVVFNGGGVDTDAIAPFLFRALLSDQALAPRPGARKKLAAALVAARQPPALEPRAALPPLARTISGTRFVADDNPIGLRTLSLEFSGERAHVAFEFLGRQWSVPLGLRGRPIISTPTSTGSPAAVSGRWVSDREFLLDVDTIAEVNHFVFRLTFDRDELRIIVDEVTGELKALPIRARRSSAFR
jgi:CubicO group peptidase (beta-lactamase class C family)